MSMARGIEIFAAINLIAAGLSHILQPRAWGAFFRMLHEKGAPGNFINAFLALGMGALIVAFHNVWSGVPMLLTIYGWASVLKGTLFLIRPEIGLRSMERGLSMEPRGWAVAGFVLVALGVLVLVFGVEPTAASALVTD